MIDFCPNCFEKSTKALCGHCGYKAISQAGSHQYLAPGTLLYNRYLIGRVLGAGGFGITYLAKDMNREFLCAIKEYLPAVLAVRDGVSMNVKPNSMSNAATFRHGLSVFHREAQTLRQFSGNPAIVQVFDDFEANGTAYFVMEYLDGVTLKALMRSFGGLLPVEMAKEILINIAVTLREVHNHGLLHRDVSPDNIFITKSGVALLIDFGATRYFVGERSQSLSVILKAGFAPPEQYSRKGKQGPWTDLYALCATFYAATTGRNIPDAPDRLAGTPINPPLTDIPGLPFLLAAAVEQGLELNKNNRPQSVDEFLQQIGVSPAALVDSPAIQAPLEIHGTPFVQIVREGHRQDKWLIPRNLSINIGRSASQCNIVVDLPNVSRRHCSIIYDEKAGLFYLTDYSTNGTFAGGERLVNGAPKPLSPGSIFYLTDAANTMMAGME